MKIQEYLNDFYLLSELILLDDKITFSHTNL